MGNEGMNRFRERVLARAGSGKVAPTVPKSATRQVLFSLLAFLTSFTFTALSSGAPGAAVLSIDALILLCAAIVGAFSLPLAKEYFRRAGEARARTLFSPLDFVDKDTRDKLLGSAADLESRFARARARDSVAWVGASFIGLAPIITFSLLPDVSDFAAYVVGALGALGPYIAIAFSIFILRPMDADARAFDELLNIGYLLQFESDRWTDTEFKRTLFKRLEGMARHIRAYFFRQLRSRDRVTRWRVKEQANQIADAVRDLKVWIALPGATTRDDLKARLAAYVERIADGDWYGLPRLSSKELQKRRRRRAIGGGVAALAFVLMAAAAIVFLQLFATRTVKGEESVEDWARALQTALGTLAAGALGIAFTAFGSTPAKTPREESASEPSENLK